MNAPLPALVLLAGTAAAASAGAQFAPPLHASLLARFDPPNEAYNDVWGYVDPSGREFAILGTTTGTFILDCSDPRNPVERAFFAGPTSGWRDMRTYGHYLYVVTEGGGGVQIIDLVDPDNPRMVKTWGQSVFSNAHNVAIDTGTGTMWACGTNVGAPIFDLSQDPENPVQIGSYTGGYVHDACVQDGYAHLAEINNGRYRILDVSGLPSMPVLGSAQVSSCHNAWPSRDGQIAVATTEATAGGVSVFDISDKRLPIRVGVFFAGGFPTVHNAYIVDRVCHMSYYTEGYLACDLSDPANPAKLASFDTSPTAGAGYTGAWGCYPFQPSGVIYVSDRDNGLHLIDSLASNRRYGAATPGAGGAVPAIHTFGAANYFNARYAVELEHAAPTAQASLLIGVAQGSATLLGAEILVDLTRPLIVLGATTDASGKATVRLPVPRGARTTLYAQWLVVDGGAASGIAASRGLEIRVFSID